MDRPPPKPATCPSIQLVTEMELLVLNENEPDVVRILAGKCCVETHGSLRFRDFQTSSDLQEAPDALMGRAFMKKQGWRSWVALKIGFSGKDWGTPFLALLHKHNMPCEDFVLKRPTPNMRGFQERAASYSDALNGTRYIMVTVLGMTPEDACRYSEHGWRHVIITAGRQLKRPLTRDQQNEVGHWVENSSMPKVYDAVASSVELQAKARVVEAFREGRRLLEPGELNGPTDGSEGLPLIEELVESNDEMEGLPATEELEEASDMTRGSLLPLPPVPVQRDEDYVFSSPFGRIEDAPPDIKEVVSPCKKHKSTRGDTHELPIEDGHDFSSGASSGTSGGSGTTPVTSGDKVTLQTRNVDLSAVADVRQVYNELTGRLHLVCPRVVSKLKCDYAVCGKWRCGTAEVPSRIAEFYDRFDTVALRSSSFNLQFQPCGSCFNLRVLRKHGWEGIIPDKDALMPSVLDADDEVSSASSSDSSLEG